MLITAEFNVGIQKLIVWQLIDQNTKT